MIPISVVLAAITAMGLILAPILLALTNDWLQSRRDRRAAEKASRESAAQRAVTNQDRAMAAKEQELAELRKDRDWWRARATHLEVLLYGHGVTR